MLEEIEQDIEQYKKIIQTKDKQLIDLKHILKAAKNSYQQVTKQKQELKQCISDIYIYIKNKKQKQQQQVYYRPKKNIKRLFIKKKLTVKLNKINKKYRVLRK